MISRVLMLLLLFCAASVWADGCEEVVDDTVGEMRAGATGWWSEDVENLVRAAAGSACVKALSGRYGDSVAARTAPATPADPGESAMARAAASVPARQATPATAASTAPQAAEASTAEEEPEAGEFSFGGLTFRSLSGSPSKKPYERTRDGADH